LAIKSTPDYTIAEFDQRQRRQRAAGVLDGDILSKSGDIFATNRKGLAAITAKRAGPGYAVVPVQGGFVARKVAEPISSPDALATQAPEATAMQPAPDRVADQDGRSDTPNTELTRQRSPVRPARSAFPQRKFTVPIPREALARAKAAKGSGATLKLPLNPRQLILERAKQQIAQKKAAERTPETPSER